MTTGGTPTINSTHLSKSIGKTVRLAGTVHSVGSSHAILTSCDNGQVQVQISSGKLRVGATVMLIARVESDLSLTELDVSEFEHDADFDLFNSMLKHAHAAPSVFGWA